MSFPYTLDLSFGSEKPTADSIGRVSFGGSNSSKVPTTQDEINALLEERKAVVIQVN